MTRRTTSLRRRTLLAAGAAGAFWAGLAGRPSEAIMFGSSSREKDFPFQLSEAEWRERLSAEEYRVLRDHGTERAFTSPLNNVKESGVFVCAGCGHKLFETATKFESGTGWPSFYEPIDDNAVGTSTDYKLIYPRTEVHCARCGGHLGHVFDDGPPPTGKRYCMNGVAMDFRPAGDAEG